MSSQTTTSKKSKVSRFLNSIERVGNKLPDPFMLFITLAGLTIILSWIISFFEVTFIQPGENEITSIKSLASAEGFQYMLTSMIDNFVGLDRKSTRLNSSHVAISSAVFCLQKAT